MKKRVHQYIRVHQNAIGVLNELRASELWQCISASRKGKSGKTCEVNEPKVNGYKIRRKSLGPVYSKRSYLCDRLLELLSIYEDLLGGWRYETESDFMELEEELSVAYEEENLRALIKRLVHYQTLIHRSERQKVREGKWYSDRSDLLGALVLVEELVSLSKERLEYDRDAYVLLQIKQHYDEGECFTSKQLYWRLRGPSRHKLQLSLRRLRESGLVVVVGGDRYSGYVYELG